VTLCGGLVATYGANAEPSASRLFSTLRELVYQVRVIDIASGDKTTIGSAFRVGAGGLLATNFHVVSSLIHEPDKYRLEIVGDDDVKLAATPVVVDVLHDLAIIRDNRHGARHFALLSAALAQGERVFSMGNPHDLGMTIVEGTYNGPLKSSRFERLLFSGSLNPGMSGGPAFNEHGSVIGVNVATGGEQISFLVPVKDLQNLLNKVPDAVATDDLKLAMGQDLRRESDAFYLARTSETWRSEPFGDLMLPRDISPAMKCWGHNVDKDDAAYEGFHQHCRSEEYIFLEDDLHTGNFSYDYEWLLTSKLNPLQFYTAVERRFRHPLPDNADEDTESDDNDDDDDHVTNYRCTTDFVAVDHTSWKASICMRRYKEYPDLNDASLMLVSLKDNKRAALIKMAATGISHRRALDLFEKLMRSVTWAD
jgi:serine protease Do